MHTLLIDLLFFFDLFFFFDILINEALNVRFQVGWDGNFTGLADEKLSLKIPNGIAGTRLVLKELPNLGRGVALDFPSFIRTPGKP